MYTLLNEVLMKSKLGFNPEAFITGKDFCNCLQDLIDRQNLYEEQVFNSIKQQTQLGLNEQAALNTHYTTQEILNKHSNNMLDLANVISQSGANLAQYLLEGQLNTWLEEQFQIEPLTISTELFAAILRECEPGKRLLLLLRIEDIKFLPSHEKAENSIIENINNIIESIKRKRSTSCDLERKLIIITSQKDALELIQSITEGIKESEQDNSLNSLKDLNNKPSSIISPTMEITNSRTLS